jgi:chromosome partitioning protein
MREGRTMRKITLVNQKGGCGKTTTAINLACCLADEGKQVLLIDLDPQGHSALGLGVRPERIDKSIYEVLSGEIPIIDAIQTVRENLDAVFSNVVLSAFEQIMAGAAEREYKLAQSLADIDGYYSYLIIDSPPSVGLLTFNGLMASDEVIIPVDPSSFALHGLGKLLHTIQIIEEKIGHKLRIRILPTNIDRRTNFCKGVVETLKDRFPENCFRAIINTSTRLREAASLGKPIGEYDEHCTGFYDYQDLTEEIVSEEPETVVRPERRAEEQEVVFTLAAPENADVQIAGDFNNWVPESLDFADSQQGQVWQKAISLRPGSYHYKYLVGGDWVPDPENDKTTDDVFGGVNSVVDV